MTYEEKQERGQLCGAYFKTIMCACNSSAHFVMNHAHDLVKHHPAYKGKVKYAFKLANEAMVRYRRGLIASTSPRFFHIEDFPPHVRQRFAPNATDTDYYDYWEAIGAQGYEKAKPFIFSMQNKYKKSLDAHKVNNADVVAWLFTAMAVLSTAVNIYESAVRKSIGAFGLSRKLVEANFYKFSLKGVCDAWSKALHTINLVERYQLDEVEDRDIEQGLIQLAQIWINPDVVFGAAAEATADFPEIFSSKRQAQKQVAALYELKNDTEAELKQNRIEAMKKKLQRV